MCFRQQCTEITKLAEVQLDAIIDLENQWIDMTDDGKILGLYQGHVVEYDAETLAAPLH